jgi:hypothetical protein
MVLNLHNSKMVFFYTIFGRQMLLLSIPYTEFTGKYDTHFNYLVTCDQISHARLNTDHDALHRTTHFCFVVCYLEGLWHMKTFTSMKKWSEKHFTVLHVLFRGYDHFSAFKLIGLPRLLFFIDKSKKGKASLYFEFHNLLTNVTYRYVWYNVICYYMYL